MLGRADRGTTLVTARGFLRHIVDCNRAAPGDYVTFVIGGAAVGRVRRDIAHRLAEFPDLFRLDVRELALDPGFGDFSTRSQALDEAVTRLIKIGLVAKRRHEPYPVAPRFTDAPLAQLDRGGVATFGVRAYGVHVNGIVRKPDGLHLWIGTRAKDKLVAPGKLDNLVAGGQPIGLSLTQNLIKECAEEADIPEALALRAHGAGAITYAMAVPEGLRADTLFVYDLAVDPGFVPRNTDGEIESFALMPVDEIAERVRATDDVKFNVNLVIIDFLIRRGVIGPEHPEYLDLVAGLHRDHPDFWR
jgi:hypothetical protein